MLARFSKGHTVKGMACISYQYHFIPADDMLRTRSGKAGKLFPIAFRNCSNGILDSLIIFLKPFIRSVLAEIGDFALPQSVLVLAHSWREFPTRQFCLEPRAHSKTSLRAQRVLPDPVESQMIRPHQRNKRGHTLSTTTKFQH